MPRIGMAGVSMLLAPFQEAIRYAGEHGFRAFEVFGEFPQCVADEVGAKDRELARKGAERYGLEILLHAPINSINIAAINAGIRKESVRQQVAAVELCADLGGEVLILHNGEYIADQEFIERHPQAAELTWNLNIESLKEIAEAAEKHGVTLALENVGSFTAAVDQSPEDLVRIKEEVGSGRLLFTLDVGHARLSGGVDGYISALGHNIRHIHFTDNFGERDDHVVIGEGNFDYTPFLDFIRDFPHVVTLEVFKMETHGGFALKSRDNFLKIISGAR
jgi:sugar phosphate isomerase/epimerase